MGPLDNLTDLSIFAQAVATGSLSGAGRALGLSLAVVSKRLAGLEARLGVRLLNRTTRRLSLTEEGAAFHECCLRILTDVDAAEAAVTAHRGAVGGLLRVTCTAAFGRRQIAPRMAAFTALYPDLRVHLIATSVVLDLVKEGIDIAIRQAVLPDSTLVVKSLAPNRRIVCAAPSYVARFGVPESPAALARHRFIAMGEPPQSQLRFERPDRSESILVAVEGTVLTNDGELAHAAALGGAGIVIKSIWDVADDLEAGHLVPLLTDWRVPASAIQAVYPSARLLPPKVRAFIDFLGTELRATWRWGET